MASPTQKEDIIVFLMPVVNRSSEQVFPNIDFNNTGKPPYEHPEKDSNFIVIDWKVAKDYAELYEHFYTDLCKSICPIESKELLAHHLSLWEHLKDNDVLEKKIPEYVVIIEDDNTIHNHDVIKNLIISMKKNNIDTLQLKPSIFGSYENGVSIKLIDEPPIYARPGMYDLNLSAYIINSKKAISLTDAIISSGGLTGISTGLSYEIAAHENKLSISRYVIENSDDFITFDSFLRNKMRLDTNKQSLVNKVMGWLNKYYPNTVYALTTPLFSILGLFEVNIMGMLTLIIIVLLIMFDVQNKFVWFCTGVLITSII
ncbi:IMv p35 heparan binding surface protein [Cetacean poxvirus 1]|nr:IMv p35 heparan binding surface protein [Cetacean poxvirus 1]